MNKKLALFLGIIGFIFSTQLFAYSYASKGKEPVIEGREAMLQALGNNDIEASKLALLSLEKELLYLDQTNSPDQINKDGLLPAFQKAIEQQENQKIKALLDKTLYQVIQSRLHTAYSKLSNHQVAKVLVVKNKLFLDLLAPKLDRTNRENSMKAMQALLASVGNPGVFGVGRKPADPKAFKVAEQTLLEALIQFH